MITSRLQAQNKTRGKLSTLGYTPGGLALHDLKLDKLKGLTDAQSDLSIAETTNLEALITLLNDAFSTPTLLLAEAYRELGFFHNASFLLSQPNYKGEGSLSRQIKELSDAGDSIVRPLFIGSRPQLFGKS